MRTTITRNVKYGAFYIPVSDEAIIQRLRHRLGDYCAVRSKTPPLLIMRMRLPPPERHGFRSPTLNPRNRTTARPRADFRKSRNITRMLRDGGNACGTDAPLERYTPHLRDDCHHDFALDVLAWAALPGLVACEVAPGSRKWTERKAARTLGLPRWEAGQRMT